MEIYPTNMDLLLMKMNQLPRWISSLKGFLAFHVLDLPVYIYISASKTISNSNRKYTDIEIVCLFGWFVCCTECVCG